MRKLAHAALFFVLACCGREALACSCVPPPGEPTHVWHKDRLKSYFEGGLRGEGDAIFLGRVTKIEEESRGEQDFEATLQVTFAVERIWVNPWAREGFDETILRAWTRKYDAMCGFAFREGGRYFVFTNRYAEASLCSPTGDYEEGSAADYLKALGEGRGPSKRYAAPKPKAPAQRPPR